nr:putative ribonuclease H-like domain-containing protein [Tanacetum cinerariifolium]
MRPFGCLVTILNTLYPLGKFDGKADEEFLVGYSNIDTDATFDVKEPASEVHVSSSRSDKTKTHDDKFQREAKGKSPVKISTRVRNLRVRNLSEEFEDFSDNSINRVNAASTLVTTAGKSTYVDPSQYPDDPYMPALEDITYSDDEEDVGAEANFSNLETNITVIPILITRVHKNHHVTQIIGDLSLAPQTRSMIRMVKEQSGLTQIDNDDFHTCMFACFLYQEEPKRVHQALKDPSWIEAMQEKLLQFKLQKIWVLVDLPKGRLVAQGHTQEEGIYYEKVFAPVARIEAIRLFLAYASFMGFMVYQMDFKSDFLYGTIEEEVYVCQPLGFEDPDYPDRVYKVVKALYGLHQAPRAWYETLNNYLSENGFQRGKIDQTLFIKKQKSNILLVQVYVDDIIFRSTNKDLCKAFEKLMEDKFQMSSMGKLTFFLGLQLKQKQDVIFISQDKYVAEILRKFGLTDGKSASTLIDTEKPLLMDPDGEDVDVHTYRSMIGSLMYLTSSRPDIMFAVCACACFQVTPKASHLHAVKRIL